MPFSTINFLFFIYYNAFQITVRLIILDFIFVPRIMRRNAHFFKITSTSYNFSSCVLKSLKSRMIYVVKVIYQTECQNKGLCFDLMDCGILFSVFHVYIPSGKIHGRNELELVNTRFIYSFFGDIFVLSVFPFLSVYSMFLKGISLILMKAEQFILVFLKFKKNLKTCDSKATLCTSSNHFSQTHYLQTLCTYLVSTMRSIPTTHEMLINSIIGMLRPIY